MPDIDKKEDYIKCSSCKAYVIKDKIVNGIFDEKFCPACGKEIKTKKEEKNE
jgi:predicted RNA-binding Zn-ribbon protein involved in translation (DUF1610 family)